MDAKYIVELLEDGQIEAALAALDKSEYNVQSNTRTVVSGGWGSNAKHERRVTDVRVWTRDSDRPPYDAQGSARSFLDALYYALRVQMQAENGEVENDLLSISEE